MERSLTAVLLLGDRSPYGLSVARALVGSRLRPLLVLTPSEPAYGRLVAHAARGGRGLEELGGLLKHAVERTRRVFGGAAPPVAGGEPLEPLVLDPGVTAAELERDFSVRGIAWERVDDGRSPSFLEALGARRPDLILSAAFPFILPEPALQAASVAAVNFHPSLLPRCRGCHPIYWTLASGESQGGATAHFMTRDVDAGDIIAQIPIPLTEEDDYGSLYRKAMQSSPKLVGMVEAFFLSGHGRRIPQDPARATYFHEDSLDDHHIRWSGLSPHEVIALARTGEAFTLARGERLGILRAAEHRTVSRERRRPQSGRILAISDEALVVEAAGGAVELRCVTWRGRRFSGGDLARAIGLKRGEGLG